MLGLGPKPLMRPMRPGERAWGLRAFGCLPLLAGLVCLGVVVWMLATGGDARERNALLIFAAVFLAVGGSLHLGVWLWNRYL